LSTIGRTGAIQLDIKSDLSALLRNFPSAPFLFIGSGISRRYFDLETWKDILRIFAIRPFEYYYSKADEDLPLTASFLVDDFHESWWSSDDIAQKRNKYSVSLKKNDSPLKIEISEYIKFKSASIIETDQNKREIELFKKINIDGIITTNWDLFLENMFPDFRVFIGQEELLFSEPQAIAEIYKIHGCCSNPNSLVLTAEDYKVFNERNKYLAAKLLTIFIEHPVIFIGCSITDKNIQDILNSILLCLSNDNINKLKDRLFFVEYDRAKSGQKIYPRNFVTSEGKNLPMTIIKTDDFAPVYEALISIERKFPARLLRAMKEHIYELVKTNDPKGKLYVVDIDDETDLSRIDVVFGIGTMASISELGYKGIKIIDLFKDLILDEDKLNPKNVIEVLPDLLKSPNKYIPVFKYLRNAGYLMNDGTFIRQEELDNKIKNLAGQNYESFQPSDHYKKRKDEIRIQNIGINEIWERYGSTNALNYIPLLDLDHISIIDLESILKANIDLLDYNTAGSLNGSSFRRLACLYDWLRFGPKS
jgi:hypothetical protein